jgi:3-mercaptopyruvate sulfurtransferase SseA
MDLERREPVKGILRAEMARRGITYKQLAAKLAELGVRDTAVNLRDKVARGGFSAAFFVQCLRTMGVPSAVAGLGRGRTAATARAIPEFGHETGRPNPRSNLSLDEHGISMVT